MPYKDAEAAKAIRLRWYYKNREAEIQKAYSRRRENSAKLRAFTTRYKQTFGCHVCGYKNVVTALELHHIDPSSKLKSVSRLVADGCSMKRLKDEMRKCKILCSNCHREEHCMGVV